MSLKLKLYKVVLFYMHKFIIYVHMISPSKIYVHTETLRIILKCQHKSVIKIHTDVTAVAVNGTWVSLMLDVINVRQVVIILSGFMLLTYIIKKWNKQSIVYVYQCICITLNVFSYLFYSIV